MTSSPTTQFKPLLALLALLALFTTACGESEAPYTLESDPAWEQTVNDTGVMEWDVGTPTDGFTPTVQAMSLMTRGLTLEEHLETQIEQSRGVLENIEIQTQEVIVGPNGKDIGVLIYTADRERTLSFLQVVSMNGTNAATATYTDLPDAFDAKVADVRSYLETIEANAIG